MARRKLPPVAARAPEILRRLRPRFPPRYSFLDYENPFQLLIKVILSAQTTDANVNAVAPALFARFPTPAALAAAPPAEVEKLVYSTGYYRSKTRNIQGCARLLVERHGGRVPETMEALLELPGVARKTANVVLTNAFGKSEGVCVDTHVGRVARRVGLTRHEDPGKVEVDLARRFPREDWPDVTYLFISHGRATCDAKRPRCGACVLLDLCPSGPRFLRDGTAAPP